MEVPRLHGHLSIGPTKEVCRAGKSRAHRAEFPLAATCRVLGLSSSGNYDWLKRPPSARAGRDAELEGRIGSIWTGSGETYGRPLIHAALKAEGERAGQKRVGRLMRGLGIEGATRRRRKTATTKRDAEARPGPDLVMRDFSASRPNQLWVADITYVPTWAGWLCLTVVLDVWSRRVVGWAMATHMRTELVEAALAMVLARRRPRIVRLTNMRATGARSTPRSPSGSAVSSRASPRPWAWRARTITLCASRSSRRSSAS